MHLFAPFRPALVSKKLALIALIGVIGKGISPAKAEVPSVELGWLGGHAPRATAGVSWGVPWPKGAVAKDQVFTLTAPDGRPLPLQTWPLAYWPDGSLKWSGFATIAGTETSGTLNLTPGARELVSSPTGGVAVRESEGAIEISGGGFQCRIPRQGHYLIESMSLGEKQIARKGRLVCLLQKGAAADVDSNIATERFDSQVQSATVEQSGPVRAVVRLDGIHKSASGAREWLPFHVRFYFCGGEAPIRMVHTIVFDGDPEKDFIRGLGVVFDVPFREEIQNRHVRFSGEGNGLWSEPVEPLLGFNWHVLDASGIDVYAAQAAGRRIPDKKDLDIASGRAIDALAAWDDYRLIQPNAQGFTVEKRTGAKSAWIAAGSGRRATGIAFVGDVSGGLAIGVKDFWQSYPKSLEVRHARSDAAELRAWLWSPDAPAMDLRHYDDHPHGLDASYEDVDMTLATAKGVARTTELRLDPTAALPSKAKAAAVELDAQTPPLLVATPQHLHDQRAFGIWSVQDRSTPYKKAVEADLDAMLDFYLKAVDQWSWYGFWDYGDVMHAYDSERHVWRYDVGGFAWDNSEQGTDMWLWYSFLRTSRADIFRMAEAMSRHTGEVDCYHLGPLAGLGSPHNVRHWGGGAKEARISMAPYRRFYYYLTTDERTGDVMREMLHAEDGVKLIDPMRRADPPVEADKQHPARIRGGPDWFALVGNWMTEWERTGDVKWRDKIHAGMDSIAEFPYWFRTTRNLIWCFDPASGKLFARSDELGTYNPATNMGGPEIMFELNEMIDHPAWQKIWLQYCRLSSAPADVMKKDQETGTEGSDGRYAGGGRMAAYAYYKTKNPAFAARALAGIVLGGERDGRFDQLRPVSGPSALRPIEEGPDGLLTNGVNQTSLQTIEILEMCADKLPTEVPAPIDDRQRRGDPIGQRRFFNGRGADSPGIIPPAAK